MLCNELLAKITEFACPTSSEDIDTAHAVCYHPPIGVYHESRKIRTKAMEMFSTRFPINSVTVLASASVILSASLSPVTRKRSRDKNAKVEICQSVNFSVLSSRGERGSGPLCAVVKKLFVVD